MSKVDDLFNNFPEVAFAPITTQRPTGVEALFRNFPEQIGISEEPVGLDLEEEARGVAPISPLEQLNLDYPTQLRTPDTLELIRRGEVEAKAAGFTLTERGEFYPITVTPTKDDTSDIFGRIKSGALDILAGGLEVSQRLPEGTEVFTAAGDKPGQPGFHEAVRKENKEAMNVFRSLSKKGIKFRHEDFEYGRVFPVEGSLDQIRDAIKGIAPNTTDEDMRGLIDPIRSLLARNEKIRRSVGEKEFRKQSEDLYSHEDKVARILDRLEWVQTAFPEDRSVPSDMIRGFFEGTLESDINKMIGWGAVTNPKKAARLMEIANFVRREIASDQIDQGKVLNFMKEMTTIIGPMVKTMSKAAIATALGFPMVGGIITTADWSAIEAGAGFREAVEAGAKPDAAALNAVLGGLINGYIEKLQVGKLTSIMKDRVKNLLKRKTLRELKEFSKNFATQTGQEALQAFVSEVGVWTTLAGEGIDAPTEGGVAEVPFDIIKKAVIKFKQEAIEVAPHMLALTFISHLTGFSVGKIRGRLSGKSAAELEEAFQEFEFEDISVQEGWKHIVNQLPTLVDKIREELGLPVGTKLDEVKRVLQERREVGEKEDLEAATPLDQLAVTSPETQAVLDESALAEQEIESTLETREGQSVNFEELKKDFDTTGKELTKKQVRDYWNEITGENISKREALEIIEKFKEIENAEEIETRIDEPSLEEGVDRGTEEEIRIRDTEQDQVTEEITEEVVQEEVTEEEPLQDVPNYLQPEKTESYDKETLISEQDLIDESEADLPLLFYDTGQERDDISSRKDDYIVFGKAQKDISYFIPKRLLDKIEISYVDEVQLNGQTFPTAEGGVYYNRERDVVEVHIRKDIPLRRQARVLYHEVMGHGGIANVIGRNDRLLKEALRLFNSKEAKTSVDAIREEYSGFMANVESQFGKEAAGDVVFSEWLAHEMDDYMVNRVEGSIGHKIWQLIREFLIKRGWAKAKNVEEFMEALTTEMKSTPASEITLDFRINRQGAAIALSKDVGKKKTAITPKDVKKEVSIAQREEKRKSDVKAKVQTAFHKRDIKDLRDKGKEKVEKVTAEAKLDVEEVKRVSVLQAKIEKEKKEFELDALRKKINRDLEDKTVRIDEFHKELVALSNMMLDNQPDRNEFKVYLLRLRPATELGIEGGIRAGKILLGAKAKSVRKLQEIAERTNKRKAIETLKKTLKNIPYSEMEVLYKNKIDGLIKDLDLSKMSKKTRDGLVKIQKIMSSKDFPDSFELPEHIKASTERLSKTAISDLSAINILEIDQQIKEIIHLHKLKRKIFLNRKLADYETILDITLADIKDHKVEALRTEGAIAPKGDPMTLNGLQKFSNALWGLGAMRPDRIVSSRITGIENSVMEQTITGGFDKALSDTLRFLQEVDKAFTAEFKSAKEDGSLKNISSIYFDNVHTASISLSEGVTLPSGKRITLTPGQRISFILHLENMHNTRGLLQDGFVFDSNINAETLKLDIHDLEAIAASAKPLEKRLAKFIHTSLNTRSREAFITTSKKIQGYEMKIVTDYFPLHRIDTYKNFLLEKANPNLMTQINAYLENAAGLQERKENARGTIVVEDALKAFYDVTKLAATYQGYAQTLRSAKQLLHDVGRKAGKKYGITREIAALKEYVRDIEGSTVARPDEFEKNVKKLMGRAASSALGLNPIVILRQYGSLPIIVTEIEAKYVGLAALILPFGSKAREIDAILKKYSPQLRQRMTTGTINAEMGDRASINEAAKFFGQRPDIFEYQTKGIEWADSSVMRRIGWAVKLKIEAEQPGLKGDAKGEAIARETERIVAATQPIYSREHRSELGRSRAVTTRLFIAFTSVTNQINNAWGTAFDRYKRTAKTDKVAAAKKLASDMFWILGASTAAMMAIDELTDQIFGRQVSQTERIARAAKYAFAPLYLSGYLTAPFADLLRKIETGKWETYNLQMANSNLVTAIATETIEGVIDISDAIFSTDFAAGDLDRLIRGSVKLADAGGTIFYGAAVRNLYNYLFKPWIVERGKPDVISEARRVGYRPTISKFKTFGRQRYRIRKKFYDDYVREIHRLAQEIFERQLTYENQTDDQKKEIMRSIYKQAAHNAGGFNMSQLVKVE